MTDDTTRRDRLTDFVRATALETIRRYNVGEITERQACDWFGVDRLTFRTALAADPSLFDDGALRAALDEWAAAHDAYVGPSTSSMFNQEAYDRYADAVKALRAVLP